MHAPDCMSRVSSMTGREPGSPGKRNLLSPW